jgi:acetyl esterase/lipase
MAPPHSRRAFFAGALASGTAAWLGTRASLDACEGGGGIAEQAAPVRAPGSSMAPAPASVAREVIPIWPEGVPGRKPDAGPERVEDGRVYNVHDPTLSWFPAPAPATRTGVIVCPGGGYARLAMTNEAGGVTRFLNGTGVAAFVLKYRLADYGHPAPLRDVLRAIRLVRSRAEQFGIRADRVGVMGSSAGATSRPAPRRSSTTRRGRRARHSTRCLPGRTSWRCSTRSSRWARPPCTPARDAT